MGDTKIPWASKVWNPVTGCSPASRGCTNCYARRLANRLKGRYGYPKDHPFRVTLHEDRFLEPLVWKRHELIFVCSMGDLFHPTVPDVSIRRVFETMCVCDWHTYVILTKRHVRMAEFFERYCQPSAPKHIWPGVSVENQELADRRIPHLLRIQAAVRVVSIEPMLGPVLFDRWIDHLPPAFHFTWLDDPFGLGWVIAGCESGPRRRPAQLDWFRSVHDQCVASSVPFFLKQAEIDGRVVEMPELDGRVWDQVPEGSRD